MRTVPFRMTPSSTDELHVYDTRHGLCAHRCRRVRVGSAAGRPHSYVCALRRHPRKTGTPAPMRSVPYTALRGLDTTEL
jgi:hypothetical protein